MKINVHHVAKLANLKLEENETSRFEKQLSEVLEMIEKLKEVDTKDIPPTSQVTGLENITRKDTTEPSLSQQEAISNAKSTHNGLFQVKGIFEEE